MGECKADEEGRDGRRRVGDAGEAYGRDGIGDGDRWAEVGVDLAAEFEGEGEEFWLVDDVLFVWFMVGHFVVVELLFVCCGCHCEVGFGCGIRVCSRIKRYGGLQLLC